MVRLVSDNSDRDLAVAKAQEALEKLAAQAMRLSAGGGSAYYFSKALRAYLLALREIPEGEPGLSTYEMQIALRRDEPSQVDDDLDPIVRHSLRLTASRLQQIKVQEHKEAQNIREAIRWREHAREARQLQARRSRQQATIEYVRASSLSEAQKTALRLLSVPEEARSGRGPHAASLKVLVEDRLVSRRHPHRLTQWGKRVLAGLERQGKDGLDHVEW